MSFEIAERKKGAGILGGGARHYSNLPETREYDVSKFSVMVNGLTEDMWANETSK